MSRTHLTKLALVLLLLSNFAMWFSFVSASSDGVEGAHYQNAFGFGADPRFLAAASATKTFTPRATLTANRAPMFAPTRTPAATTPTATKTSTRAATITPTSRSQPTSQLKRTTDRRSASLSTTLTNTWAVLGGPFSPSSIALPPSFPTDGRVFVGSGMQQVVFQSSDRGQSWQLDGQLNNIVTMLAVSPNFAQDSTMFASSESYGAYSGAVHKSTDGGRTWNVMLYQGYVGLVALSPNYATDQTLFAASRFNGIFKSSDGGVSWTTVYTDGILSVVVSPAYGSDQTLFATYGNTIIKSTDGGNNWVTASQVLTHTPRLLAMSPGYATDRTLFAVAFDAGYVAGWPTYIYKTIDGGQNWALVTPVAIYPYSDLAYSLAISPNYIADATLFLARSDGLYRSTDGGLSWQRNFSNPTASAIALAISPGYASDGTVFAILAGALYKSGDQGTNWRTIMPGLAGTIAFAPASTLYTGSGGGIFKSIDNGATWSIVGGDIVTQVQSLGISPFYQSDGTIFAGQSGYAKVFKTTNGGTTWSNAQLASSGSVTSLSVSPNYTSDNTVFAGLSLGAGQADVFRSRDGGITWNSVGAPLSSTVAVWAVAVSPNFVNDNTVLAGTENGLFKSADAGNSWTAVTGVTNTVRSLAISPNYASDHTIFVGSIKTILKSTDGGQTWGPALQNIGLYSPQGTWENIVLSPTFASDGIVFAGGRGNSQVILSRSNGACWDSVSLTEAPDVNFGGLALRSVNGFTLFVAGSVGLYQIVLDFNTLAPVGNVSSSISATSPVPANGVTPATVTVTLRDASCNPVIGQWVDLLSDRGSNDFITYGIDPTNSSGQATYSITSTITGTATIGGYVLYFQELNAQAAINFVSQQRIPVIIVPGYFASDCANPSSPCSWVDHLPESLSLAYRVYQPLFDALVSAGYQRDLDLFIAFYDWAQPNTTSATRLASIVNQASLNSPTGKVHIITHSNGANVARAYVQQGTSKVDTLILIAPPSQGVVLSYPGWEGADTSQIDLTVRFVSYLRMIYCQKNPWEDPQILLPDVQACLPSLRELLPVGDSYLTLVNSDGSLSTVPPINMQQQNTFLQTLNTNVSTLYQNVSKVVVIASQGTSSVKTLQQIYARPYQSSDGVLWIDGKPQSYPPITSDGYLKPGSVGDNTVLLSRASLPSCQSQPNCFWRPNFTADHKAIINQAIPEIFQDLGIPVTSAPRRSPATATVYDELMYAVSGANAQLLVQDPMGRKIGYQADGSFASTIPNAMYTQITSDAKLVVIPNPVAGTYIVNTVALGGSTNYIGGAFSYATGTTELQMTGTLNVGTSQQYTHPYQPPSLPIYLPFVTR